MLIFALVNKLLFKVVNLFYVSTFLKYKIKIFTTSKAFECVISNKKEKRRENRFRGNVVVEIIQYPGLFGSIFVLEEKATNCSKLKRKKTEKSRMGKRISMGEKKKVEKKKEKLLSEHKKRE